MRRRALRSYIRYYRQSRARLGLGLVLSLLQAFALIPVPLLVRTAIDESIPNKSVAQLVGIGFAILGLTTVSAVLSLWASYVTASVIRDAIKRLRQDAVARLFAVSRRYVTSVEPSVLHDQIVQESGRVNAGTTAVLDNFLPGTVLVIGIGAVLVAMNPTLALVTLLFGPAILIVGRILGRALRVRVRNQHLAFERFSRSVLRILRAMDLIRSHGAERDEMRQVSERATDLEEAGLKRTLWGRAYSLTQSTLLALAGAAVLIVGGVLVVRDRLTLGDLISFYAGFALLRGPLAGIALRVPSVIEGLTSLAHLNDLLEETDVRPYSGSRPVESAGEITLEDVTFAYDGAPVLRSVSLRLEPGKVVAVAGPNGSGKSTIVNLILGFYRPEEGRLTATGVPYSEVDLVRLRRSMGVVAQQTVLLPGSVRDNVTFARDSVDDEAVRRALEIAEADFVWRLPEGLDTDIGEEGVFLSGGQRQRLAIARAVIHRPSLLILDEPTNHLDRDSMDAVMHNIARLEPRPAVLLISHRPEVLSTVDEVIQLADGRVVSIQGGTGTPRRPGTPGSPMSAH